MLNQRASVDELAKELQRFLYSIHPDLPEPTFTALAYTEEFLVRTLALLPTLAGDPQRDLLGRALGKLGTLGRSHLNPASRVELAKALGSPRILTAISVDQICKFLESADSGGKWELKKSKPGEEQKFLVPRNEHTNSASRVGITQGVVGMFKAQVLESNASAPLAIQWVRSILETFHTDREVLWLTTEAVRDLPFDAQTRQAVQAALHQTPRKPSTVIKPGSPGSLSTGTPTTTASSTSAASSALNFSSSSSSSSSTSSFPTAFPAQPAVGPRPGLPSLLGSLGSPVPLRQPRSLGSSSASLDMPPPDPGSRAGLGKSANSSGSSSSSNPADPATPNPQDERLLSAASVLWNVRHGPSNPAQDRDAHEPAAKARRRSRRR